MHKILLIIEVKYRGNKIWYHLIPTQAKCYQLDPKEKEIVQAYCDQWGIILKRSINRVKR